MAVLLPRLLIVTWLTEALPVALIPEQLLVSAMRNNVIHHSCLGIASLLHALHTQWMFPKVRFAYSLPLAGIASAAGRSDSLRVQCFVLLTVFRSWFNQHRTARMAAWHLWLPRHTKHLLQLPLDDIPAQFCVRWCPVRHAASLLPRQSGLPEVAVAAYLVVVHIQKPQPFHDTLWG